MWPAWRESSMRFFSGSISSGKTVPSLFLHKQLDVTRYRRALAAHGQRRYNVLALEGHMARKRVKESGPSLLLVALIAAQAAAYEHPLNSSAIWNAYFLGSSNSE